MRRIRYLTIGTTEKARKKSRELATEELERIG